MTPNDIEVLLHCHVNPAPHPRKSAPAVQSAMRMLFEMDLIECRRDGYDNYITTEKGRVMVDMICNTPLPVQKWVRPDPN